MRKPLHSDKAARIGIDTQFTKTRASSTRCIPGSTVKPWWSNYNTKKEHDHWCAKEADYMEKDPPEQLKNSGKIIKVQPPGTSTSTVGEGNGNFTR